MYVISNIITIVIIFINYFTLQTNLLKFRNLRSHDTLNIMSGYYSITEKTVQTVITFLYPDRTLIFLADIVHS